MKRQLVVFLSLMACTAWSIGLGVGGFGGVALPTGDMAAEDDDTNGDWDASELGSSPLLGGKILLEVIPMLELEAAVAYHTGHPSDVFTDVSGIDETSATIVPITFGANVKYKTGLLGVYGGGGLGYYFESVEADGNTVTPLGEYSFEGTTDANGFGLYVSGGVLFNFGKLALDVNPRYHYIMNDGDVEYTATYEWQGFQWSDTETAEKTFGDTYVDIRAGVDYFFL
jgi:hypothetical protein